MRCSLKFNSMGLHLTHSIRESTRANHWVHDSSYASGSQNFVSTFGCNHDLAFLPLARFGSRAARDLTVSSSTLFTSLVSLSALLPRSTS